MNIPTTIRKGIAGFLLALLFLSACPKQFLHKAFANHTDSVTNCQHESRYCLHQSGYNCHFDNLVVGTDYVFHATPPSSVVETLLNVHYTFTVSSALKDFVLLYSNKGPPVLA